MCIFFLFFLNFQAQASYVAGSPVLASTSPHASSSWLGKIELAAPIHRIAAELSFLR